MFLKVPCRFGQKGQSSLVYREKQQSWVFSVTESEIYHLQWKGTKQNLVKVPEVSIIYSICIFQNSISRLCTILDFRVLDLSLISPECLQSCLGNRTNVAELVYLKKYLPLLLQLQCIKSISVRTENLQCFNDISESSQLLQTSENEKILPYCP